MPTKINWADETWNPIVGCTKCSPGCLNCYAERMAKRQVAMGCARGGDNTATWVAYNDAINSTTGKWSGDIALRSDQLNKPLHWKEPRRIFVCSMSDLFHPKVPFEFILKMVGITIATPWHTYLILTKRPKRMYEFFACWPDGWFIREGMKHSSFSNEFFAIDSIKEILPDLSKANDYWKSNYDQSKRGKLDGPVPFPQPNLHLGVSISNPDEMWKAEVLSRISAAVRWISFEPLLGDVGEIPLTSCREDDTDLDEFGQHIDWVVVGGESGPGARPMHPDWARNIRDQCVAAGVPFYFKQWGEWLPGSHAQNFSDEQLSHYKTTLLEHNGNGVAMFRVGKKKAGCLLDNKIWKQLPQRR